MIIISLFYMYADISLLNMKPYAFMNHRSKELLVPMRMRRNGSKTMDLSFKLLTGNTIRQHPDHTECIREIDKLNLI